MDFTTYRCDLPHHPEAPEAVRRQFSLDGHDYVIDLCAAHDQQFTDMAGKYAQAARPGPRHPAARPRRSVAERDRSRAIRAWALSQGTRLEAGGRLPVSVIRAYDEAHRP